MLSVTSVFVCVFVVYGTKILGELVLYSSTKFNIDLYLRKQYVRLFKWITDGCVITTNASTTTTTTTIRFRERGVQLRGRVFKLFLDRIADLSSSLDDYPKVYEP